MATDVNSAHTARRRRRRQRPALASPWVALVAAAISGCAPLSHSRISLDGSATDAPSAVATLELDPDHPLILRGLDATPIRPLRVPSALRTWSFSVKPGRHLLWASSVPYGLPLLPQSMRCYAIDVQLEAGAQYVLRHDADRRHALVVRRGAAAPEAIGRLVDEPSIMERSCRWDEPPR